MSVASSLLSASPRVLDAAVRRVPITGGVERVSAPEGASLAEFVAIAFPVETHRRFVVASIDGEEVAPEAWARVPRAGEHVTLAFRPGGKDFFRIVLQIAVIAVAAWVGFGGLGGWFAAGTWQAAVAAAGVSILGNLAINALIPLPKPGSVEAPPPYYSLATARNTSRPWGPVPMLFGTHRIAAPRMSEPFQEVLGGVTYLRVALCLGLCPMQVADWKIGETALSAFSGVEMEVRLNADDPAHTLITGDPTQEAIGATLTHTEWTERTTATDVDEIEVIYDFPSGLGGLDSKGRKTSRTVNFRLQYRPTGSSEDWSDWRPNVPQANEASSGAGAPYRPEYFTLNDDLVDWRAELDGLGGVANGVFAVTRADPGRPFRHSERFAVPRGQYDVRTQRVEAASTDPNIVDAVSWGILGSIRSQADPFPNRKLATACFRIRATEQLSNMVDTLNCIASSLQPVFSDEALADPTIASATEFADVETSSNPAVLALLAARGPNTAFPKPDAEIDWPAWAAAAAKAAARGLTFNEYVETAIGRWEMVRRILAAMHARPVKHNGKLSVVVDDSKAGQAPAQVFSPRNVRNFRWQKTYPRLPHAIRTPFANAANGWQADEVTVYMPGYAAETATRYETVAMPGKTDADEIRTVVNQYARNGHYQTESFEFETDAEHLTVKRGDYCVVQHFAMATGLGAARIRTRELNGSSEVTAIVLDRPVETPEGESLAVQWRTIVADSGLARMEVLGEQAVTRDAANPKRFVFTTPQAGATKPAASGEDYEGDIALVGLAGKVSFEVLVRDIAPRPHLQAAISCVAYAGERFVDAPEWPAHDPRVTLPYAPRPPAPVLQAAIARDLEIAVAFTQPAMPRGLELQGYVIARREHGAADDTWEPLGRLAPDERVAVAPAGEPGAAYDIRIVAFGKREDGVTVYSDALIVEDVEAAIAPAAPAGCGAAFSTRTSSGGAQQLVLTATWTVNENPDVLDTVVEQRVSTGPDVWQEIGRGRAAAGMTEIHGLPVGRDYVLGFVNLSKRGAPSARTTIATISAPDTLVATAALAAAPDSALADALAALDAASGDLDDALAAEAAARAAADTALAAADAVLDAADATLAAEIDAEAVTRAAADTALDAADALLDAADAALASALTTEAGVRAAADTTLTASLATANAAITTNASAIATETAARAAADTSLTAQVVSLRNRVLPSRPAIATDFTTATGDGTPDAIAALSSGTVVNVANEGDVRQFTAVANLLTRGWLPVVSGRTYRLTCRTKVTVDGTANVLRAFFQVYTSAGVSLGLPAGDTIDFSHVAADGWQTHTLQVTGATILAAQATAAFVRPRLIPAGNAGGTSSGATVQVSQLLFEDITDIATANAAITTNASAIATETAARAAADTTLTASLATANAAITTNATAIATETAARTSADSTLTASLATANANIATNATAITTEAASRASADTSLAADIATANAAITTNATAIATETAARTSADSTLTASLATANANIATNATAIATETAARTSADSTLTASLATANANIATNATAITTEAASRASADTSLTAQVVSLRNRVLPSRPAIATDFTTATGDGTPDAIAALSSGTVVNVANEGDVRQFTAVANLLTRGWLPVVSGRTYRLTCRTKVTADGTANVLRAFFQVYTSAGVSLALLGGETFDAAHVAADGWQAHTLQVTGATILAAQATAAFVRPRLIPAGNAGGTSSGATVQVSELLFEDITDIATANAAITTNAAALATETAARTSADTTLTASLATANAAITTNATAIATEEAARISADTALTASLGTTNANVSTNASAIAAEAVSRAAADSTLTASLATANANIATNATAITTEASARASADTSLAADIATANAAITTNASAIATETAARTSADSTLTASLATANANIATNATAIATETAARTSADSTLTASLATANAAITTNATAIASETAARTTADTSLAASFAATTAGAGGLLSNAKFMLPLVASIPTNFANWSNGAGSLVTRNGNAAASAFRLAGGAGANAGVSQYSGGYGSVTAGRKYLARASAWLQSGTWNGAGLYINWLDSGGASVGTTTISFANTANTDGITSNAHAGLTNWDVPVTAPAGASRAQIFVMSHWSSHSGGNSVANSIDWYEADLIPQTYAAAQAQTNATAIATEEAARISADSTLTASLATANAAITANATAIATETAARTSADSTLTASLGTTNANVSTNASAIATINGAAAFWDTIVSASGGDLAAVRLRAGAGGSFLELISTVLRLANVSNGDVIEVMRAVGGFAFFSNPVSIDVGSVRLTLGPGFGASSDLLFWFGPNTTAIASMTKTNGYWAWATDGETYKGADPLTAPTTADQTFTKTQAFSGITTSGATVVTMATIDVSDVGTGGFLNLPLGNLFIADATANTSDTLDWSGTMTITEQLQSGGTEHTLWSGTFQLTNVGGFYSIEWPSDVALWPSALVAQNLSGDVRYRMKIARAGGGSNNIGGGGLDGQFMIQRVPG